MLQKSNVGITIGKLRCDMKPRIEHNIKLRILVVLGTLGKASAVEIGERAGPSWRSGASWAGPYLRSLVDKRLVSRKIGPHGKYTYMLTPYGRQRLNTMRSSSKLVEATWSSDKRKTVQVMNLLIDSPSGMTIPSLLREMDKNRIRSREWVSRIVRKLLKFGFIEQSTTPSGGRPAHVYRITSRGLEALKNAYVDGASAESLTVHDTEPKIKRTIDGNETGQDSGLH